jgi:hypothetical protein
MNKALVSTVDAKLLYFYKNPLVPKTLPLDAILILFYPHHIPIFILISLFKKIVVG